MKILLLERHRDTAKAVMMILQVRGHRVHWATSVSEATQLCGRETFDLLISETYLPDGTGLEFMRDIARPIGLRGITLTAMGRACDEQDSLTAGFCAHLTKPVTMDQLVDAVERAVAA